MAYTKRFEEALLLASRLHRDQVRKAGGVPYVTHLLSVAALVGEAGGTEDEVIAALLHDAIEDQGDKVSIDDIRSHFGEAVADTVWSCSDTDETPKPPWRERKEKYLAHLPEATPSARLVSCADKLHNSRSIVAELRLEGDAVWERFKGGREGSLWYYRSLVELFREHGAPARLLDELTRTVETMGELAG